MEQLSRRLHQCPSELATQKGAFNRRTLWIGQVLHYPGITVGTYKEVAALSPVDAAYIAGLIDGEGTITLSRRHVDDRRQLVVSIANTEISILQFVLDSIGAGKITRKRISASHHTPSFAFAISNRQALELLKQIQAYLRSHKRERARLALDQYTKAVPRNGKYSPQLNEARLAFEARFFAITARAHLSARVAPLASPRSKDFAEE